MADQINGQDTIDNTTTQQEPETDNQPESNPSGGQGETVTLESLMVQIQELKADNAKLKNSNDRLSSESGTLRKQLREKMTAEERENEAKAEKAAADKAAADAVKKELEILKGTNRYIKMGFDEALAAETAAAAYDHDQVTVDANFAKWQTQREKAMETRIRDELLKNMPSPQSGNQAGGVDYAKQQADALEARDMDAYAASITAQWRASQNS